MRIMLVPSRYCRSDSSILVWAGGGIHQEIIVPLADSDGVIRVMVPSHMGHNDCRFGRIFRQLRELLRKAEGFVAGVEENRSVECGRFLTSLTTEPWWAAAVTLSWWIFKPF